MYGNGGSFFVRKLEKTLSSGELSGQTAINLQTEYELLTEKEKPEFVMALIQAVVLDRHRREQARRNLAVAAE